MATVAFIVSPHVILPSELSSLSFLGTTVEYSVEPLEEAQYPGSNSSTSIVLEFVVPSRRSNLRRHNYSLHLYLFTTSLLIGVLKVGDDYEVDFGCVHTVNLS
ncbi:hypothetical protein TNCV_1293591 [Trichonephila clavipes]|nr:hypothetical protein TNCV_787501 [Trichonephila clavipes]GFV95241.1 hypothetical protein TNCV_1293591 [Trichonephila clavipes]